MMGLERKMTVMTRSGDGKETSMTIAATQDDGTSRRKQRIALFQL